MIVQNNRYSHGKSLLNTHLKVGPWPRPALRNNIYIGVAAWHLVVRVKYAMFFISFNNKNSSSKSPLKIMKFTGYTFNVFGYTDSRNMFA